MATEYDLLILAPQIFMNDLQPLVDHKNDTGIHTKALSLEQIYKEYSGCDKAEKVKACLFHAHLHDGIKYAMLVGDEDQFPIRFTKWSWEPAPNDESEKYFHTLYISTDQYYAALHRPDGSFDNWDANQDGVFGESFLSGGTSPIAVNPDKVHMIPQIAVGRIPASDNSEVKNYVSKVIDYEKQDILGLDWRKNLLLVLGFDPDDPNKKPPKTNYGPFVLASGNSDLISKMFNVQTIGFNPGNERPDPDKINKHIDNGVGFVIYNGHGGTDRWAINWHPENSLSPELTDINYSKEDVLGSTQNKKGLDNPNKLPVIFAESCNTGQFGGLPPLTTYKDINGIDHDGFYKGEVFTSTPPQPACIQTEVVESMAEATTVMKMTGAIGYVGATLTSGSPDENMLYFFLKALHDGYWTLGDTWKKMMEQYYQKYIPPDPNTHALAVDGALIMPWRYCLFGDPSLRLRGVKSPWHLSPEDTEVHVKIVKLPKAVRDILGRIDPVFEQSVVLKASDKVIKKCNEAVKENPELAFEIYPNLAVAWNAKGVALKALDRTKEANAAFAKAQKYKEGIRANPSTT